MRILQVHPFLGGENVNPRAGGKSRISQQLSRYLIEQGHSVALFPYPEQILERGSLLRPGEEKKLAVLATAALPSFGKLIPALFRSMQISLRMRIRRPWQECMLFAEGLARAITAFQPQVVHSHRTLSEFPILFREVEPKIPIVLTHHTGQVGTELPLYQRIAFVSKALQEDAEAKFPGLGSGWRVIYNPLSPEFLTGGVTPWRNREGILFAGGLTSAKGLDLLLEAYRTVPALCVHPLYICGAGALQGEVEVLAKQCESIRFVRKVTSQRMRELLSGVCLLVNPSRLEGFSTSLSEAMACGTPVVGWTPQVRELEARWGEKVGQAFDGRTQNARELADAILSELIDGGWDSAKSKALAVRARHEFSLTQCGESYLRLYSEVA